MRPGVAMSAAAGAVAPVPRPVSSTGGAASTCSPKNQHSRQLPSSSVGMPGPPPFSVTSRMSNVAMILRAPLAAVRSCSMSFRSGMSDSEKPSP